MDARVGSKGLDLRSNANASGERSPLHAVAFFSSIFFYQYLSVWRNWIARETSNLKVAGSNPVMDKFPSIRGI